MTAEPTSEPKTSRRRWFAPRFTIRALLVVMTLLSIVLGTWVARARRQLAACAELKAIDAEWEFDEWEEGKEPAWFRALPMSWRKGDAVHYWRSATSLSLPRNRAVEAARIAAQLPRLRILTLSQGRVTGDTELWQAIGRLSGLRELDCRGARLDDAGMTHIGELRLERLGLRATQVGDEGVRRIRNVSSLKWLDLSDTAVTDEAMFAVEKMTRLESLYLAETVIGTKGVRRLAGLNRLEELGLSGTRVDDGIVETVRSFEKLSMWNAEGTALSDDACAATAKCPELVEVRLSQTGAGRKTIAALANLPKLESVGLAGVKLAPGAILPLAAAKNLRSVRLPENSEASDVVALLDAPIDNVTVGSRYLDRSEVVALSGVKSWLLALTISDVRMTADDWRRLGNSPTLTWLRIDLSDIDDEALAQIARIQTLKELTITGAPVTDEGIARIAKLANLERLAVFHSRCTDEGFARLGELSKLQWLELRDCDGVTDASLDVFARWPVLQGAIVASSSETESRADPDRLRAALANCPRIDQIDWRGLHAIDEEFDVFMKRPIGPARDSFHWPLSKPAKCFRRLGRVSPGACPRGRT